MEEFLLSRPGWRIVVPLHIKMWATPVTAEHIPPTVTKICTESGVVELIMCSFSQFFQNYFDIF